MQTLRECPTNERPTLAKDDEVAFTGEEPTDPITSPTDSAMEAVMIVFLEAMRGMY